MNVIAGWTGLEADVTGGLIPEIGDPLVDGPPMWSGGTMNPEAAWNYYVNGAGAGSFGGSPGGSSGNIYINDAGNTRNVEVGSRYGNTNVAGNHIFVSGGVSTGNYAHLRFHDNGEVFYYDTNNYNGVAAAGNPLIGMVGVNEAIVGGENGVLLFDSAGPGRPMQPISCVMPMISKALSMAIGGGILWTPQPVAALALGITFQKWGRVFRRT